ILVPQTGHVPVVAGLPFFSCVGWGSLISLAVLHFMQKPVTAMSVPLRWNWDRNCVSGRSAALYWPISSLARSLISSAGFDPPIRTARRAPQDPSSASRTLLRESHPCRPAEFERTPLSVSTTG